METFRNKINTARVQQTGNSLIDAEYLKLVKIQGATKDSNRLFIANTFLVFSCALEGWMVVFIQFVLKKSIVKIFKDGSF